MLTEIQLAALQCGMRDGFMKKSYGMARLRLVAKRTVFDEVRRCDIPTGDYELTPWGHQVAANYKHSVERLKPGTRLNHTIHSYRAGTVVLADDGGKTFLVDVKRSLKVQPDGRDGGWFIPLKGGGYAVGSAEESWYLRNYLDLEVDTKQLDGTFDCEAFSRF
jgi:hypothetical protein